MDKLEIAILALFLLIIIAIYVDNRCTTKKIRKFNESLTDFERTYFSETISEEPRFIDEKHLEYYLLRTMPRRLDKLEFCYRCPLYRDKVREGTGKNLRPKQEK